MLSFLRVQEDERSGRRDSALLLLGFALLVLLRLLTVARDPWEWDEVLFTEGARDGLDVRLNHPHAPGYPGFVYAARLLVKLGAPAFEAVTAVALAGGLVAVLGVYALMRAFGSARRFAALAAAAFGLIPSVWLHSVRPLSDAPGIALFLFAASFIVRAIREGSGGPLVVAAFLCALAAGIRPQCGGALLPAAIVAAAAVWRRERRIAPLVVAAAVGILVSLAVWVPAIRSSGGFASYREVLAKQVEYVAAFERPTREVVLRSSFWKRWWYDPYGGADAAFVSLLVAASALILDRRRALAAVALFLPVTALTMLTLGRVAAPRYAIAFLPLPAMLLAFAAERLHTTRARPLVFPLAAALFLATVLPAIPAIAEVHDRPSPTVAAVTFARERAGGQAIAIHPGLVVHAELYLAESPVVVVDETRPEAAPPDALLVWVDGEVPGRSACLQEHFEHGRMLEKIARPRFLRAAVYGTRLP
jgi:hypothetical protein